MHFVVDCSRHVEFVIAHEFKKKALLTGANEVQFELVITSRATAKIEDDIAKEARCECQNKAELHQRVACAGHQRW